MLSAVFFAGLLTTSPAFAAFTINSLIIIDNNTTSGYTGPRAFTILDGRLNNTAVSPSCYSAWNATINCDTRIFYSWAVDQTAFPNICLDSCRTSLLDYGKGIEKNCATADITAIKGWVNDIQGNPDLQIRPSVKQAWAIPILLDEVVKGNTSTIVDYMYYSICAQDLNTGTYCATEHPFVNFDFAPLPAHLPDSAVQEYCNDTCVLQAAYAANEGLEWLKIWLNFTELVVNDPADTCAGKGYNLTVTRMPEFQAVQKEVMGNGARGVAAGMGMLLASVSVCVMVLA